MELFNFGKKKNSTPEIDFNTIAEPGTFVFNPTTADFIAKNLSIPAEEKEPKPETKKEEWIWVEGYKGTDKDMCCRGYQYALGKRYYMPEDATIEECESGFHLCRDLTDVFDYYKVGDGNRYFKVKALVRKGDYETYGGVVRSYHGTVKIRDKLAAKSIEFVSELTADEICEVAISKRKIYDVKNFTKNDRKRVIALGIQPVWDEICHRKLIRLGYSKAFAHYILKKNKYEAAYAVGTQEDLSMDVKVMLIFND